jgi:hypothetical protein
VKPASTISTLGDVALAFRRCSGCCDELPLSTKVEVYETPASLWIIAECPRCTRCTPFQLEKAA